MQINNNYPKYKYNSFAIKNITFNGNSFFEKQADPIIKGCLEEVQKIGNFKILGDSAETLLHIAVEYPNIAVVDYLSTKLSCNLKDLRGLTAFNNASKVGNLEALKLLFKKNALIDTQDNFGNTPLINGIAFKNVFKFLLDSKANPNIKNNFGQTPALMLYKDLDSLELLYKNGANFNLRDINGQALLHYGAKDGDLKLLEYLTNKNIDLNITDEHNETPIFLSNGIDSIELLLSKGANVNHQNIDGETILHKAIKMNNQKLIDKLLEHDLNLNLEDKFGRTPAFHCKNEANIKKLLTKKLNVNHQDKEGETLLHKYAKTGNVETINLLLNSGANTTIKNKMGKTPFDLSETNKQYAVSNILNNGSRGLSKVIGMTELKQTLIEDVIDPIRNKEEYQKYGRKISNGIMLHGLPGCGKTFIAEALAEETGRHLEIIKPSNVTSHYYGDGVRALKKIFDNARSNSPSIIFIDELEGVAPSRTSVSGGDSGEAAQDIKERVTELLQQINNCSQDDIFIIGATNNPEQVDSALKRAGRLDKKIFVPPPDNIARIGLFRKEIEKRPHENPIDYKYLAGKTENYIAEDIRILVDEAAKYAQKDKRKIKMNDLTSALKKIKASIAPRDIEKYRGKVSTAETNGIENIVENNSLIKGFAKVSGMQELKRTLAKDIIMPLNEIELCKKYGIESSNGILMYGPPGCGKTFIAEALAEETGRHFIEMKPSTILSPYQHQTVKNIRNMFDDAIFNSPSIIFIDEIEALAPSRSGTFNISSEANEQVTELLQQINNCAKHNVFVIAASNEPQKIDEAIRRVGRFDKTIFVPPPDKVARKEIFENKLKDLYIEKPIDYQLLSDLTENFTAPEIDKSVIQEAAKIAMADKVRISQKHLTDAINNTIPKLNEVKVKEYKEKI